MAGFKIKVLTKDFTQWPGDAPVGAQILFTHPTTKKSYWITREKVIEGAGGGSSTPGKDAYQSYLDTTTDNPPLSEAIWSAPYILPIATSGMLGGVRVGNGISINPTTGIASVSTDYQSPLGFTPEQAGVADSLIQALKDGVSSQGNTLKKLYDLIISQYSEITVATIAERNIYNVLHLPTNIFVNDDGDGKWALYKATTIGINATYIKLSDPDLLNSVMTASQIASAYESVSGVNRFTNTYKTELENAYSWGNHALAGYQTKTQTDLLYKAIGWAPDLSSYATKLQNDTYYLGINAQSKDSAKLGGNLPSYFQPAGNYLTGITSGQVIGALGYTPLPTRTFGTASNANISDFEVPLTFTTGLSRVGNTISNSFTAFKTVNSISVVGNGDIYIPSFPGFGIGNGAAWGYSAHPTTLVGYGITDTPWTSYLSLSGGTMINGAGILNANDNNGYGAIGFNTTHNAFGSPTFPTILRSSVNPTVLVNTNTYTLYHNGNLTNNNQLTNGSGYITSSALSSYSTLSNVSVPSTNIAVGNSSGTGLTYVSGFYYNAGLYVPASVTASQLQINTSGRSEGIAIRMTSGSAEAGLFYTQGLAAGTSNGIRVLAGTNASDYALNIYNQAGTSLFKVDGNGLATFTSSINCGSINCGGAKFNPFSTGFPIVLNGSGAPYYGNNITLSSDTGSTQGAVRIWGRYDYGFGGGSTQTHMSFEVATNTQAYGNDPSLLTYIERMRLTSGGNLVVGFTSDQGSKLAVNGTVYSSSTITATNFIGSSDARLKNIYSSIVPKKLNINYKEYEFKNQLGIRRFGVIAQDLLSNGYGKFVDTSGKMYGVNYIDLLISEVVYLKAKVEELERRIN